MTSESFRSIRSKESIRPDIAADAGAAWVLRFVPPRCCEVRHEAVKTLTTSNPAISSDRRDRIMLWVSVRTGRSVILMIGHPSEGAILMRVHKHTYMRAEMQVFHAKKGSARGRRLK